MLVYTRLIKHQKEFSNNIPLINFLKATKPLFEYNAAISARQEFVENEIISLLRNRDIDAIVIKGNAIAQEIYNDPNCRTSSDIDILVRSPDVLFVDTLLSEAGYIGDQQLPLEYCFYRLHHATYTHPRNYISIEMHWMFGILFFYNLSSEEIWQEMVNTDSDKVEMSPEITLIHLLINHHMHSFRKLKTIVDILWCLYKYENDLEWSRFVEKLRKIGLIKIAFITLHQIQSLWKEQVTDMVSFNAFNKEITHMGFKRPQRLIAYFHVKLGENYASRILQDKLMARLALDKWSTIILSYLKTPFPNPRAIKGYYRDQRNWILPLHYVRFMLWRMKEWFRSTNIKS